MEFSEVKNKAKFWDYFLNGCQIFTFQMFSSGQAEAEPAWTGFAMEQIMKTLSFVNSSLVQAPPEEKEKLAHKLDDTLYCAKVRLVKIQRNPEAC